MTIEGMKLKMKRREVVEVQQTSEYVQQQTAHQYEEEVEGGNESTELKEFTDKIPPSFAVRGVDTHTSK
jgi:hypothetical protein